jgi:hypothetical protein
LVDYESQENDLTRLSHSVYNPDFALADFWLLTSENCAGSEFVENGREVARNGDGCFDVRPNLNLQSSILGIERAIAATH